MSDFANGKKGDGDQGKSRSSINASITPGTSRFGKRTERPDMELMRVLNTGSNGPTHRVPRSVSPPLD